MSARLSGEMRDLWEPALLVSTSEGSGEDGLLGASEIARLEADADWLILSARNTAAGDDTGSPAYSGLASVFTQVRARSLMLSHWRGATTRRRTSSYWPMPRYPAPAIWRSGRRS